MAESADLAAHLLRQARQDAGMTQVELAAQAGVTQSVISAYESGHRHPSLGTLAALISGTGYTLDIRLRRESPTELHGPLGLRVRERRDELLAVAEAAGVRNIRVFGSVARGEERPDSDVDLVADIPSSVGLFALGRLRDDLERIVGARVDLVPADGLKPDVRSRIDREAIAL